MISGWSGARQRTGGALIEIRRLLVGEEELKHLITKLIMSQSESSDGGGVGSGGMVMDIKIIKDEPLLVQVYAQTVRGNQIAHKMDDIEVMTAIINHCISKKIPISRQSRKSVKRTKDGVALDMVIAQV